MPRNKRIAALEDIRTNTRPGVLAPIVAVLAAENDAWIKDIHNVFGVPGRACPPHRRINTETVLAEQYARFRDLRRNQDAG